MCKRSTAVTRKKLYSWAPPGWRRTLSRFGVDHGVLLVLSRTGARWRPIPRLRKRLIIAERRMREGEQHIAHQEKVIAHLKREERDLAIALSVLDTLIETQKAHLQVRNLIGAELERWSA